MRKLCGARSAFLAFLAFLVGALPVSAPPAEAAAEYLLYEVWNPADSGAGTQWMALTLDENTAGGPASIPMDTEANLPAARDSVYLTNGGVAREGIKTLFLVLPGGPDAPAGNGTLWVSFDSAPAGPYTQDITVDSSIPYHVQKETYGAGGTDRLFEFKFSKTSGAGSYGSVRSNLIFTQLPSGAAPQTINIPFVVANVCAGTAEREPLRIRSSIRDSGSSGSGNIVAHDRFTWDVAADKNAGANTDWVFVPIQTLPQEANSVYYQITTEAANYSGIRYAVQRYDGRADFYPIYPAYWTFDIAEKSDASSMFQLNQQSHIPPGLVTTYRQSFNVVSGVKELLRLYPVNPAGGFRTLTIGHRSIFGLDLGTFRDSSVSPSSYAVTGFNFLSAGVDFLEKTGEALGVSNVGMPEQADGVMPGAVKYEYIGGDVIASLGVSAGVPARLRAAASGLLPLHITFNLRRSNQLVGPHWETFREQWRETGNIESLFADYFSLYAQDSAGNNVDIIKDCLNKESAYEEIVKVFFDEQREVVTVHFIAFLMDGPRSAVRIVRDETSTTDNAHLVLMDGNPNDKWEMKFFAAPAGYVKTDSRTGGEGSGGGCGLGLGISAFLACAFAILRWRRKE